MELDLPETLSHLRQIDEYEFEQFVADLWDCYGWEVAVTTGSNDRGIDIIAQKEKPLPQKHLIQAKRWGSGNKVGGPQIQQYSSLQHRRNDVDAVAVVTTSSYSRQAIEEANALNVKLVDGTELYELIADREAWDLLEQYTTVPELESSDPTETDKEVDDVEEGPSGPACPYCEAVFEDERAVREHLHEAHDRDELSRIDRKRVDLFLGCD